MIATIRTITAIGLVRTYEPGGHTLEVHYAADGKCTLVIQRAGEPAVRLPYGHGRPEQAIDLGRKWLATRAVPR